MPFPFLLEAIALTVPLEDLDVMGEAIEKGSGQTLGAEHLGPLIEGLWRSVKYEEVYLRAYGSVCEARASIGHYFAFYNARRHHSSLGGATPDEYYARPLPEHEAAQITAA